MPGLYAFVSIKAHLRFIFVLYTCLLCALAISASMRVDKLQETRLVPFTQASNSNSNGALQQQAFVATTATSSSSYHSDTSYEYAKLHALVPAFPESDMVSANTCSSKEADLPSTGVEKTDPRQCDAFRVGSFCKPRRRRNRAVDKQDDSKDFSIGHNGHQAQNGEYSMIYEQQACFTCDRLTLFEPHDSCYLMNDSALLVQKSNNVSEDAALNTSSLDEQSTTINFTTTPSDLPALAPGQNFTNVFVSNLIAHFLAQKCISADCALEIVDRAFLVFDNEPNVVDISIPPNGKLTIVGDVHGQYFDFMAIFDKVGMPGPMHYFLFNGDFVDRGPKSVETLLTLLSLKILMPSAVFLNRGNHEAASCNFRYGFYTEFFMKFRSNTNLYDRIQALFNRLPLASRVQGSVFVVHGGIAAHRNMTIHDILALNRTCDPTGKNDKMVVDERIVDLLWSDPQLQTGTAPSDRGVSMKFGPDVTADFLAVNNLTRIIRSHESVSSGYEFMHNDQLVTVFSAPNYENTGNIAAVMHLFSNLTHSFDELLPAQPR